MHTENRQVIHLWFRFFKYFEEVERDGPINGLGLGLGAMAGSGARAGSGSRARAGLGSGLGIYR